MSKRIEAVEVSNVRNGQSKRPVRSANDALFSPRQVAKAIGVSESSLKRWCDSGLINAAKTAGGHRRLVLSDIISFLRKRNLELRDPTAIGLPNLESFSAPDPEEASRRLVEFLIASDETGCRELLLFLYVRGWSMADIFDSVVSPAFKVIGDRWNHGELEIFEERMACEVCINSLHEIRSILTPARPARRTAIGGALEHDHYQIPTIAVQLTLISMGWSATSYGTNLPLSTLAEAARVRAPDLLWISISHVQDAQQLIENLSHYGGLIPVQTRLVIGGSALSHDLRRQVKNAICCDNLSHIAALVRSL